MENYPTIQRRDGTLFFACPEFDKGAIATSIERLIDMLDAMEDDPDLEPDGDEADTGMPEGWRYSASSAWDGRQAYVFEDDEESDVIEDGADDEPSLGAPERQPNIWTESGETLRHSQERWAQGLSDSREDDGDDLEPDEDGEGLLGNAEHIDQSAGGHGHGYEGEESDLGWNYAGDCGDVYAANDGRELDDEREFDPADAGVADRDALSDLEGSCSQLPANDAGFAFDNTGVKVAEELIRGLPIAARRAAAYSAVAVPSVYHGGFGA